MRRWFAEQRMQREIAGDIAMGGGEFGPPVTEVDWQWPGGGEAGEPNWREKVTFSFPLPLSDGRSGDNPMTISGDTKADRKL